LPAAPALPPLPPGVPPDVQTPPPPPPPVAAPQQPPAAPVQTRRVVAPRQPAPPAPQGRQGGRGVSGRVILAPRVPVLTSDRLPDDGRQLVDAFTAERLAIQEEAARRIEFLRQELVRTLETLQEQYTTAGQLDEAVAIRDYLRALQSGSGRGLAGGRGGRDR
jgi:hypothetical protein